MIIGDPRTDKSEALLRAFGRFVNRLNGLFYTGEDVGTDVRDLETVAKETAYVGGLAREHGGGGDPSPVTAYGVFQGMKACDAERWGSASVRGRRVAVQGLGKVGWDLVCRLQKAGATVIGCDVDPLAPKQPGSGCRSQRSNRRTFTASPPISSHRVHSADQSLSGRFRDSTWRSSPDRRTIRFSTQPSRKKFPSGHSVRPGLRD